MTQSVRRGDYRVITKRSLFGGQTRYCPQRRRLFIIIPFWSDLTVINLKTEEQAMEAIRNDKYQRKGWKVVQA
ncbi:hypothetical protein ACLJYM_10755 [Rhizobium giardinii]|uniref:hypothetical protein n=1 Tax=Rhizobium giardinii TaxID=56731 RepID=UPI0039E0EB20